MIGNALVDADGRSVELTGVNSGDVTTLQDLSILFKVIRRRWNMNAVRIPVSVAQWKREGSLYLSNVVQAVDAANQASLAVILVARHDARLPSADTITFWLAWAERFRGHTRVIFDVFDKPSPVSIPGHSGVRRELAEWETWLNGGRTADGQTVVGMRQLVDAIRSVGAGQLIAAQAFDDRYGFESFETRFLIPDSNVMYEVHPYFDRAQTAAERDRIFGTLAARAPVLAGEWGLPVTEDSTACRAVPSDRNTATNLLNELVQYFLDKRISWTVSSFEPGSLIVDYQSYANTRLEPTWSCGSKTNPISGIGEFVLLATTGDPTGFVELVPDFIANAATGVVGPVAPGEIIAIYGVEIGPYPGIEAFLQNGRLPTELGSVRVLFDDVPAPIFFASAFQVNVQVPYSIAGKRVTKAQLFYDGVPSSRIDLPVEDSSPGIFASLVREARALNQDGSLNSSGSPAVQGSVVALFGTGMGVSSSNRKEGDPAVAPLGLASSPVSIRIGGIEAEVLYAGEAPGLIGVAQFNVRVPAGAANSRPVTRPIDLSIGSRTAASPVTLWIR